jgi:hypothetical protein
VGCVKRKFLKNKHFKYEVRKHQKDLVICPNDSEDLTKGKEYLILKVFSDKSFVRTIKTKNYSAQMMVVAI